MKQGLLILSRTIGVFFFLIAFVWWATYDYPEYYPFSFLGGVFPGSLGLMINYGVVVGFGFLGMCFFKLIPESFSRNRD